MPVTTTEAEVERSGRLGELPAALRSRLESTYGITPYDSDVLVNQGRALVDYYIETADLLGDGKLASNWMQQDVLRTLNEQQTAIEQFPIRPKQLAELIDAVRKGRSDHQPRPRSLCRMLSGGKPLAETMAAMGIAAVDESELENPLPRIVRGQSESRRRSQGRQAQGPGAVDRPGEEEEPQCESEPVSGVVRTVNKRPTIMKFYSFQIVIEKEPEDSGYYALLQPDIARLF